MSPQTGELLLEEVAPRIRSLMPRLIPIGSEDIEELAQDTLAIAASLLESVEARGKKVSAGNIAYYAVKICGQGRRSTGFVKTDALHPAAKVSGRSRVVSLEEPVKCEEGSEEPLVLGEVLASEAEDPSATGARNELHQGVEHCHVRRRKARPAPERRQPAKGHPGTLAGVRTTPAHPRRADARH